MRHTSQDHLRAVWRLAARSVLPLWVAIALASCIGSGPAPGDALFEGSGLAALDPTHDLPPGEEWALILVPLTNRSTEPLRIRRIDLLGVDPAGPIKIVRTRIWRFDEEAAFHGGTYKTYPPITEVGEEKTCMQAPLESVDGFQLGPGEASLVATHIRARATGVFSIRAHRVRYVQGDTEYQETVRISHSGTIAPSGISYETGEEEAACAEQLGVDLLPSG